VRVVAFLAFIFLKSRVFMGVPVELFVTGGALPDGGCLEQVWGFRSVGVVTQLTIPGKP
jgi:hypothetical protein